MLHTPTKDVAVNRYPPGTPQTNPEGHRANQLMLKLFGHVETIVPYSQEDVYDVDDTIVLSLKVLGRRWAAVPAVPSEVGPSTEVVRTCCSAGGT